MNIDVGFASAMNLHVGGNVRVVDFDESEYYAVRQAPNGDLLTY